MFSVCSKQAATRQACKACERLARTFFHSRYLKTSDSSRSSSVIQNKSGDCQGQTKLKFKCSILILQSGLGRENSRQIILKGRHFLHINEKDKMKSHEINSFYCNDAFVRVRALVKYFLEVHGLQKGLDFDSWFMCIRSVEVDQFRRTTSI